jgi:hypothetical protein
VAAFALIAAFFALFIPRLTFSGDIKAMAPHDLPSVMAFDAVNTGAGGADSLVVALEARELFSPALLADARALEEELLELEDVADIVSPFSYASPAWIDGALSFEYLIDPEAIPQDKEGIEALKAGLKGNKAGVGFLVSEGFDAMLLLVQATAQVDRPRMVEGVKAVVARHPSLKAHLTGTPVINYSMIEYMRADMVLFVVFGFLSVVTILLIGFKSLRGVALPLITIAASLLVTFGLMGMLGMRLTIVSLIIPVMLIAICNNYAIHFLTRHYEDARDGGIRDREELLRLSFKSLSRPVWLAFITTVASFLSFVFSPLPRMVETGLFIAFGIGFSFLMTLFFIPAFLSILPLPKARAGGREGRLSDKMARAFGGVIDKGRFPIVALALAMTAGAIVFIPRIKVDSEMSNFFNPEDPVRSSIDFINERLGGSQVLKVLLPADPRSAEGLARLERYGERVSALEGVGGVISAIDPLLALNQAIHEGDPAWHRAPDSDAAAFELFFAMETSLSSDRLAQLVTPDYAGSFVNVQLKTRDSGLVDRIATELKRIATELGGEGAVVAGTPLIASELNGLLINSMLQSLAVALVVIFLSVAIGFGSAALGALISLTMGLVITMIFGLMGIVGIELSTATALVAGITLGVGIDYSIHFAARWVRERKGSGASREAAMRTLATTGKGIVINAMAIAFAVIPPFFSKFRPVAYFGLLCFASIILSLAAGLCLMPSVLSIIPERHHGRHD